MSGKDFSEVIDLLVKNDRRFDRGAYFFVRKALDYTVKELKPKLEERGNNHVSGLELLEGIREYALDQYGPMALTVLQAWNIQQCSDFGDIVFNLVEYGVLGKTEKDRREDFCGGYDFNDAFLTPFIPSSRRLPSLKLDPEEEVFVGEE